jgi:hypothetical protein
MASKIASVHISIPYKGPGNTIRQKPVLFDVYSDAEDYKAIPVLNEDERRIANLPDELRFGFQHGKPFSHRGAMDGNFHVIEDIVNELQKQQLV